MNHRPCLTKKFNVDRACCVADVRDNINIRRWGDAARAKATKIKIFLLSKHRVHILMCERMHGGCDENNT